MPWTMDSTKQGISWAGGRLSASKYFAARSYIIVDPQARSTRGDTERKSVFNPLLGKPEKEDRNNF